MLFVTSVWDAVSKVVIALSITRSLLTASSLVRRREQDMRVTHVRKGSVRTVQQQRDSLSMIAPALQRQATFAAPTPAASSKKSDGVTRLLHRALALWGAVVAACHLHAVSHTHSVSCVMPLRPWFASASACSFLILDCRATVGNIETGAAAEFDRVLSAIDPRWLASLTIRHCPHVEITPTFLRLHALMGFKIFNSTLMRWDDDAALSRKHHPQAKVVHLLQTSMAALPAGLYGREFPPWLQDIEILECNVTHLPLEVADAWAEVTLLKLEGLAFADGHVPEALTRLRPTFLALSLNGLTSLPRELMENPRLQGLMVAGNPVVALPEDLRVVPRINWLVLDGTNVSDLPSWIDVSAAFVGFARMTPLCDMLLAEPPPERFGIDSSRLQRLRKAVVCGPLPSNPRHLYQYPVLAEARLNP
ncbi:hypothetical protein PINS_up024114 [Pythium insidiosum]|nr:hypothetical protein PINS_up024114 [Pythium insidiosum]